ncbi:PQQ-dependent sugar dehydrogenase [Halegenticoccus soli]|uniref:PQQ-dependent sugar dehydrogenase n=1 Tax=Halegenticoccus soli TaxID=1985678 RepID=UPI001E618CFD|nr:PQQ-dependent sugar dehydrogenase [Halegenticoccus soli]
MATSDKVPASVGLRTVVTNLRVPLDVAFAPHTDRRYIADQVGIVYVHGAEGLREKPFLDLQDAIEFGTERGLLGIALHPGFNANKRVFVRYSAPRRPGTPSNYSHTFVLAEFEASDDGLRARRDSERTILEIPEPYPHHNGGAIAFGPDGYLYVAVGDGGGDGGGIGSESTGQDVTQNLLGSILRLDVDTREGAKNYAIPADNPLVDTVGLDEQYAWGFRNPWRMSFDEAGFFVGDVGENRYEEVNLVEKGGNYGWRIKEGTSCVTASSCRDGTPITDQRGDPLIDPIISYPHSSAPISGASVIGGYVYRGSALPSLEGAYVFGDLIADSRLFAATRSTTGSQWLTRTVEIVSDDRTSLELIYSFGRDDDGELYVLGSATGVGSLFRLVPAG